MSNFFNHLVNENMIYDWAATLDWLFNDNRFDKTQGWTSGYVGSFTKKIKQMTGFSDKSFVYDTKKQIKYPKSSTKKKNIPFVVMQSDGGEGKDFIRHIRNGIAHGNTHIFKLDDRLCIEIIDYGKTERNADNQTAYICIPMEYITGIHKIYLDVKKSKENARTTIKRRNPK